MAFGDVSPGFGGSGGFDAPAPGGSADIGLPNIPVPKKKKKPVAPPVTPLPTITPAPTPVADSTVAFQESLAAIVADFAAKTAAIAAPVDRITTQPVGFAPAAPLAAPTILGGLTTPTAPTPPPVPKRVPAQGVTPAAAANRQKRRAAGAAKPRTILTSGQGLLDLEADQSQRAKKTLLGA